MGLIFVISELHAERTYTAPQKWMRGKGRVTIQFGCCYNYATVRIFYLLSVYFLLSFFGVSI